MQKFFGKGFGAFVQYVMSCDPSRSLIVSTVDLSLPRIGSNAKLERMVDCIYFAYLVKLPPSVRILDVLVDFEAFKLPIPTIPNVGIEVLHSRRAMPIMPRLVRRRTSQRALRCDVKRTS